MTELATEIAAALRRDGEPATAIDVLATALSVPPFVTWEHLRGVRRQLLGAGSLVVELDLADSHLVVSVTRSGLVLSSRHVRWARTRLRTLLAGRDGADRLMPRDGGLPPLLAIEARLTHAFVSREEYIDECESMLRGVLLTLTQENRDGIRDWATGALHRLPREVVATSAGYLLCGVVGIESPVQAAHQWPIDLQLARDLSGFLPTRLVGLHRDGAVTDFGPPSRSRPHAISVPTLPGVPLRVSWSEDGETQVHLVDLARLPAAFATGTNEVAIEDFSGARFTLEAFEGVAPELIELTRCLEIAQSALDMRLPLGVTVLRRVRSGYVVGLVEAPALTAYVYASDFEALRLWSELPEPKVLLTRVDPVARTVLAAPAPTMQRVPEEVEVGDVVPATVASIAKFGVFVRMSGGMTGLLHDSEVAASLEIELGGHLLVQVHRISLERDRIWFATSPPRPATTPPRHGAWRSGDETRLRQLELVESIPVGWTGVGPISKVVPYGYFVALPARDGETIDGLLHNSQIAAGPDLDEGDTVEVEVILVEDGRISLATHPRKRPDTPERVVVPRPPRPPQPGPTRNVPAPRPRPAGPSMSTDDIPALIASFLATLKRPISLTNLVGWLNHQPGAPDIGAAKVRWGGFRGVVAAAGGTVYTAPDGIHFALPSDLTSSDGEGGRRFALTSSLSRSAMGDRQDAIMARAVLAEVHSAHAPLRSHADVRRALRDALKRMEGQPVGGAMLSHALLEMCDSVLSQQRWFGFAKFVDFLQNTCPEVSIQRRATEMYVSLPASSSD